MTAQTTQSHKPTAEQITEIFLKNCVRYPGNYEVTPGNAQQIAAYQAGQAAALADLRAGGVELPILNAVFTPLYTELQSVIQDYGDRRAAAVVPEGMVLVRKDAITALISEYDLTGSALGNDLAEIIAAKEAAKCK